MARHAKPLSPGTGETAPSEIRRQDGIAVHALRKRYGDRTVIDGISFHARPGRITGFLGANGAGKTTTLRMITGLAAPSAGEALIAGKPYRELVQPCRWVGAVLDASHANPAAHTGRAHLRIQAGYAHVDDRRVTELLHVAGLAQAADRPIRGYSLGMRQRLILATALLADPPILILDEPSNGLDPEGNRWLWGLLCDLASRGRTVLVSSHSLTDIEHYADDVVMIQSGRIRYAGTLASLSSLNGRIVSLRTPRVDGFVQLADSRSWRYRLNEDSSIDVFGVEASVIGQGMCDAALPVFLLTENHASLEDMFISLAGSHAAHGSALPRNGSGRASNGISMEHD